MMRNKEGYHDPTACKAIRRQANADPGIPDRGRKVFLQNKKAPQK